MREPNSIVKRLRVMAKWETPAVDYGCDPLVHSEHSKIEREAAALIEQMMEALEEMLILTKDDFPNRAIAMAEYALAAAKKGSPHA